MPPIVKYLHTQQNAYTQELWQLFSDPLHANLERECGNFRSTVYRISFIAFLPTILQKQCRSVLNAKGQQLARVSIQPFSLLFMKYYKIIYRSITEKRKQINAIAYRFLNLTYSCIQASNFTSLYSLFSPTPARSHERERLECIGDWIFMGNRVEGGGEGPGN